MKPHKRAFVAALSVTLLFTIGCSREDEKASKASQVRPGAPVTVATAVRETVPLQLRAIGNVETIQTVSIRAQVQGDLVKVYFKEGQDVKKGDLLFQIDPRVYEDAVNQAQANLGRQQAAVLTAQANLARDEAQGKLGETQERRYKGLAQKGVVSQDQYDQVHTTYVAQQRAVEADKATIESAKADVRAAEAAVHDAQVKLGFTRIRAPISGRTGTLKLKEGNLVSVGGDPLVVINQISPVYVSFSVPEQYQGELRAHMAGGKLPVTATPQQGAGEASQGWMSFVENSVDLTTGTIRCTATFPNERRLLWPGQFVNATITLEMLPNAIVVPSRAIQNSQRGSYVYVVKSDMTAEQRLVQTNRQYRDLAIIDQGLQAGESVVTDGHLKVVPGGKVQILRTGAQTKAGSPVQGL